jgi:hypothetical protein
MNLLKNTAFFILTLTINIAFASIIHCAEKQRSLLVPEIRISRWNSLQLSTIPEKESGRARMRTPSPIPRRRSKYIETPSNLNNFVTVKSAIKDPALITLENLPITIRYKKQQQDSERYLYFSEEIVTLAFREGIYNCLIAKNDSHITFQADGAQEGNIILETKNADVFTIGEKDNHKIIITKNGPAKEVATFTFSPEK